MIRVPDGWRRVAGADALLLTAPDGTGHLRYRERVGPLRRVDDLVAETLAGPPEWRTLVTGAREPITTHEGEHAFWVPVAGQLLGAPARRFVGVIYGDDCADIIDAVAIGATAGQRLATLTRELCRDASLGLGVRRRRYLYRIPEGWQASANGLVASFYPPGFPRRPATLVVYPANPSSEPPETVFDSLLRFEEANGLALTRRVGPEPISAQGDLAGKRWHLVARGRTSAPPLQRDLVIFARAPYVYCLHLDVVGVGDGVARAAFLDLARSVEPVPPPGVRSLDPVPASSLELFESYS